MRYVLLAHRDGAQWEELAAREREELEQACRAHEADLKQSGYLVAAESVHDRSEAVTVKWVDGELSFVDDSHAPTEASLMRVLIIEARDLNHAIRVASNMPLAWLGPIEVRPATARGQWWP